MGRKKCPAEKNATADKGEILQHEVVSRKSRKCSFGFRLNLSETINHSEIRGGKPAIKGFDKTDIIRSLGTMIWKTSHLYETLVYIR